MPNATTIDIEPEAGGPAVTAEVPTEQEVLEFANKVRAAGGADFLDALLPSEQSEASSCLIANALNFSCKIQILNHPYPEQYADGTNKWGMYFPKNIDANLVVKIGEELDLPIRQVYDFDSQKVWAMEIPVAMRNAAMAFDEGTAFTKFIIDYEEGDLQDA